MSDTKNVMISVRISEPGVQWLDNVAYDHHMTRTELIKSILRKAARDYDKGWRP